MAAGRTYTPISTTALTTTQTSVTFSSIPSGYTDLVLVANPKATSQLNLRVQFNSDTGSNYSHTYVVGTGSATESGRGSNGTSLDTGTLDTGNFATILYSINNYSNITTYKTLLSRSSDGKYIVGTYVGLWRSTAAINSITINTTGGVTFAVGSTFTLYGIAAA